MTQNFDHIVVGSGINGLVCAALLAKSGRKVALFERNEQIGGCIRTEELTVAGFKHDVMSSWHPLFMLSPAYAELGDDLRARGLEYCHTETPTASLMDDDHGFVMRTDRQANVDAMNALSSGDGDNYAAAMSFVEQQAELTFATLGEELWRIRYLWTVLKNVWRRGPLNFSGDVQRFMENARTWLQRDFRSAEIQACFAPWVLHAGLSPDASFSGHMAKVITFSLEAAGTPMVKGGSAVLLEAFEQLLHDHKAEIVTNADVDEVLVENGRAVGVITRDQRQFLAKSGVICSTTPGQLYTRLLRHKALPEPLVEGVKAFRHGLADMQIHIALDGPPVWRNQAMNDVAMVHVQNGIDGVAEAIAQAKRGHLPQHATIVVGQPCAVDPSRAPPGKSILWIQLQELPSHPLGDAAGEIDVDCNGQWTETLKERYADRIVRRLAGHIENLPEIMLGRHVCSPADLERMNINLVGGDPYGGDCGIDQFLFWRPLAQTKNHSTPVKDLYHIGASTHPGPGLGGGSGYLVAQLLLG